MYRCVNCLSENLITINENNKRYYACLTCGISNTRILDSARDIKTENQNGLVKHYVVGAIIKKNNRILLLNQVNHPFGLTIPSGHIEFEEKVEEALSREVREETSLTVKKRQPILSMDIIDHCKNGGEIHEWNIFECECEGRISINSESNRYEWIKISELENASIVPPIKFILEKIGLIKNSGYNLEIPPIQKHPSLSSATERLIIDDLPVSIFVFDPNLNIIYANNSGNSLLNNLRTRSKFNDFSSAIKKIADRTISSKITLSSNVKLDDDIFNLVSNPLIKNNKIENVSLTVKNVTDQKMQKARDLLSYKTSLDICLKISIKKIIKTILKQTLDTLDLTGCSLMLANDKSLKVAFRYSRFSQKKRKPLELKIGEGIAGWVASKKTPLSIPDTGKDPLYKGKPRSEEKSLLSVPVISANILFGVLNVSKVKGNPFTEEETQIIMTVANRIALALENEKLYTDINVEKMMLETVLGTSSDGLILLSKDFDLKFANNASKKIVGLTDDEIEDHHLKNFLAITSQKNSTKFVRLVSRSINQKKKITTNFVSTKGPEKVVATTFNPVIEKNGKCNDVLISFKDITTINKKGKIIKNQMAEIKNQHQKTENIINNTGDGILVMDVAGKILIQNKAIEKITGFENIQQCISSNPEILVWIERMVNDIKKNNRDKIYSEIKIINADGQEQYLGATCSLVRNDHNNIDLFISVLRDISKEKTLDNQQKEFIYTATHELRTPITAIKGYLSMILNGDAGKLNDKQKQYFAKAYSSTDKLVLLVEDLLKAARLEENKMLFSNDIFSAKAIAQEVCGDFCQKASGKDLGISIKERTEDLRLMGDYEKTKQALSNLVDNAIKYTREGRIEIIIDKNDPNFGRISVKDSGVGIPKKEQSFIFNKFHRVFNPESVRAGGTGLGLFIVKNLIEKQGGRINVVSKLGKGSEFNIKLPLANKQ